MGVATIGRLKGNVSEKTIATFLREHYKEYGVQTSCDTNHDFYSVSDNIVKVYADDRMEILAGMNSKQGKDYYLNPAKSYVVKHGFIVLEFPAEKDTDEKTVRHIFYQKSSVNCYENLEYFEQKGLADMVKAETTYISLSQNEQAEEIIRAIVEHFGGWYAPNDVDNDFVYFEGTNQNKNNKPARIDVIVRTDAIGTDAVDATIVAITAIAFNALTNEIYGDFRTVADISRAEITGASLVGYYLKNSKRFDGLMYDSAASDIECRDIPDALDCWMIDLAAKLGIDKNAIHLWSGCGVYSTDILRVQSHCIDNNFCHESIATAENLAKIANDYLYNKMCVEVEDGDDVEEFGKKYEEEYGLYDEADLIDLKCRANRIAKLLYVIAH